MLNVKLQNWHTIVLGECLELSKVERKNWQWKGNNYVQKAPLSSPQGATQCQWHLGECAALASSRRPPQWLRRTSESDGMKWYEYKASLLQHIRIVGFLEVMIWIPTNFALFRLNGIPDVVRQTTITTDLSAAWEQGFFYGFTKHTILVESKNTKRSPWIFISVSRVISKVNGVDVVQAILHRRYQFTIMWSPLKDLYGLTTNKMCTYRYNILLRYLAQYMQYNHIFYYSKNLPTPHPPRRDVINDVNWVVEWRHGQNIV